MQGEFKYGTKENAGNAKDFEERNPETLRDFGETF
jgi:hypothetical protein